MTQWNDRLKARLAELGWSVPELARRSGVPEQSLYKYIQGRISRPRGDGMKRLAQATSVSEVWLAFGSEGADAVHDQIEVVTIPIINVHALAGSMTKAQAINMIKSSEDTIASPDTVGPHAFAIYIEDDAVSVAPSNSKVIVDPDLPVVPGKYVAAMSFIVGHVVIRRWRATNLTGAGELIADHQDFPAIPMRSDADGFILGRAVEVLLSIR